MRTSDFTMKPSSKVMNETLNKKFGEKLDIENYSNSQLQKASSLIESRIAVLKKGKFNETLESEEFHRLKLMQDIVKTAITERAKKAKPDYLDFDKDGNKKEPMKKALKDKKTNEAAKPDFLDLDKDGNKKEPMKKAAKDKKVDEVSNAMKQRAVDAGLKKGAEAKSKGWNKKGEEKKGAKAASARDTFTKKTDQAARIVKKMDEVSNAMKQRAVDGALAKGADAKKAGWNKKGDEKKGAKAATSRDTFRKKTDQAGRIVMKMKESILREFDNDMSDWVNSTSANFKTPYIDDWMEAGNKVGRYLKKKGVQFDTIDDDAEPVLVFLNNGKPVAWYDIENAHGHYPGVKNPRNNYAVRESIMQESVMKSISRLLREGEESKAELIMAVKDMVDKFTGWSEDIAQMQAQTAMEMADAIRDELGADQAEAFTASVQPALDAAFQAVKGARESLNNSVASLTGVAPTPMGAEPGMDDMGGMDAGMDGMDAGMDDMGGDMDAGMPTDDAEMDMDVDTAGPVDRAKRESIEHRLRLTKILVGR